MLKGNKYCCQPRTRQRERKYPGGKAVEKVEKESNEEGKSSKRYRYRVRYGWGAPIVLVPGSRTCYLVRFSLQRPKGPRPSREYRVASRALGQPTFQLFAPCEASLQQFCLCSPRTALAPAWAGAGPTLPASSGALARECCLRGARKLASTASSRRLPHPTPPGAYRAPHNNSAAPVRRRKTGKA